MGVQPPGAPPPELCTQKLRPRDSVVQPDSHSEAADGSVDSARLEFESYTCHLMYLPLKSHELGAQPL